tara:strand:+ start:405 stop:638 length:234 start_codon:yes stop_codon:yes gene_type:complete
MRGKHGRKQSRGDEPAWKEMKHDGERSKIKINLIWGVFVSEAVMDNRQDKEQIGGRCWLDYWTVGSKRGLEMTDRFS